MEKATPINKKDLKKQFKLVYPKFDAEKKKEVSREDASHIIVECMKNVNQVYTNEQAVKILEEFDVANTGNNAKNEVKVTLMIAAKIEELNKMEVKVNNDQIKELIAKLDSTNDNGLYKKELKLIVKQMIGRREIDFDKAFEQRAKFKVKQEKKKLKQ